MQEKKFDKIQYINEWKKKNKKQFKVELDVDEYNTICKYLLENNMTKVDFVRLAIKKFIKK